MSRRIIGHAVVAMLVVGCAGDTNKPDDGIVGDADDGGDALLGDVGDRCSEDSECESPLDCIDGECNFEERDTDGYFLPGDDDDGSTADDEDSACGSCSATEECNDLLGVCVTKMVRIPGGYFGRGCDPSNPNHAGCCSETPGLGGCESRQRYVPFRQIWVDDFSIDIHEVTSAQLIACRDRGGCRSAPEQSSLSPSYACDAGSVTWLDATRGSYPVNCVSFEEAREYCAWVGKELPTGAQWEKAARGTDGHRFPWGNDVSYWRESDLPPVPPTDQASPMAGSYLLPVTSVEIDRSAFGVYDMAGSLIEMVSDTHINGLSYNTYLAESPERNPTGPAPEGLGSGRSARGAPSGVWSSSSIYAERHGQFGFRCAK